MVGVTPVQPGDSHDKQTAQLNQLLFEHRMTCEDLADQFGVTRSVISRKLRG